MLPEGGVVTGHASSCRGSRGVVEVFSMARNFEETVRSLSQPKALAIGCYGESVASYRYRMLAEKATTEEHRAIFVDMAEEEQTHHQVLQQIFKEKFPDSDFVLSPEDKDLIIAGSRTLDLSSEKTFARALELIYESERKTGQFYTVFHNSTSLADLKPLLKGMADECFEHAERLKGLPPMPWS